MRLLPVVLLACTGVAFAGSNAPISYHEGTLVSSSTQGSRSDCTARAQQACNDTYQVQYFIKSEGILYALTPVSGSTGSLADRATLGISRVVGRNSSLYHQLPGTRLRLRDDGSHTFVKVGNRESRYIAVEAVDVQEVTATAQADQP